MRLPDFLHWTPEERRAVLAILLFTGGGGLVVELLHRFPIGAADLRGIGLTAAADSSRLAVAVADSSAPGRGGPMTMSLASTTPVATPGQPPDAPADPADGPAGPDEPRPGRPMAKTPAGPVDVNHAGVDRLTELPGIGPKLAERIVADRTRNGPFRRPADLDRVKGIGPALLKRLTPLLTFGPAAPDSASRSNR